MDFLYSNENLYFGSDVVDLNIEKDRSYSQLQRYSKKICTDSELSILADSKTDFEFEQKLWRIWSLKESSYKASQRKQGERRFKYRDFDVAANFEVVTDQKTSQLLTVTTLPFDSAIVSVAYFEAQSSGGRNASLVQVNSIRIDRPVIVSWLDNVSANLDQSFQHHSWAVRQQLKEILFKLIDIEANQYSVNRRSNDNGDLYPPELIIKDQVFPISFSHHGKYLLTTLVLQGGSGFINDLSRIQTTVKIKWPNRSMTQKNGLVFFLPTEF